MILRNLTSTAQTVSDGASVKTVSPQGLVAVTPATGARLLSVSPAVWIAEQALIPPPPSA